METVRVRSQSMGGKRDVAIVRRVQTRKHPNVLFVLFEYHCFASDVTYRWTSSSPPETRSTDALTTQIAIRIDMNAVALKLQAAGRDGVRATVGGATLISIEKSRVLGFAKVRNSNFELPHINLNTKRSMTQENVPYKTWYRRSARDPQPYHRAEID